MMKCDQCQGRLIKVDRRNEMDELDDSASEGQFADYIAAELGDDNGDWNLGIIEYTCTRCKTVSQIISDSLPDYSPLILAWHDKAAEGDPFSKFIFQYLCFIAHIKNNLFIGSSSDRQAIQQLKRDEEISKVYVQAITCTECKSHKKPNLLSLGLYLLIAGLLLTACGTARTVEFVDHKEIHYEGFTEAPTQHEVRSTMEGLSMKECPNGYQVISQRHSAWPRSMVWKIKCD